jgi:uncharacterized membrane protein YGL010W
MRTIDRLLERYGDSHRNAVNKSIHWICVPLITWSVLAATWALSPIAAYAVVAAATAFYLWLSPPLAAGMLGVCAAFLYPIVALGSHAAPAAGVVFVVAWIGQFGGHAIEGKKPSFLEDVKFLLVGPRVAARGPLPAGRHPLLTRHGAESGDDLHVRVVERPM